MSVKNIRNTFPCWPKKFSNHMMNISTWPKLKSLKHVCEKKRKKQFIIAKYQCSTNVFFTTFLFLLCYQPRFKLGHSIFVTIFLSLMLYCVRLICSWSLFWKVVIEGHFGVVNDFSNNNGEEDEEKWWKQVKFVWILKSRFIYCSIFPSSAYIINQTWLFTFVS